MAKIGRDEAKGFSPIDSKLLGTLANSPVIEAIQPEQPPPAEPVAQPAIEKKAEPPRRARQDSWPQPKPAAVARPQPQQEERLTRVVKCLLSDTEEQELRNLLHRLRQQSGISLTFGHLMRPCFDLLLRSEPQLAEELTNAGLRRPINDKNAIMAFERELAVVIHEALRKTDSQAAGKKD